jgi:hypothetical protein
VIVSWALRQISRTEAVSRQQRSTKQPIIA